MNSNKARMANIQRTRVCKRCGELIVYPVGQYVSRGGKICNACKKKPDMQRKHSKPIRLVIKELIAKA